MSAELTCLQAETGADEILLSPQGHSLEAQFHLIELIANAFDMPASQA